MKFLKSSGITLSLTTALLLSVGAFAQTGSGSSTGSATGGSGPGTAAGSNAAGTSTNSNTSSTTNSSYIQGTTTQTTGTVQDLGPRSGTANGTTPSDSSTGTTQTR